MTEQTFTVMLLKLKWNLAIAKQHTIQNGLQKMQLFMDQLSLWSGIIAKMQECVSTYIPGRY